MVETLVCTQVAWGGTSRKCPCDRGCLQVYGLSVICDELVCCCVVCAILPFVMVSACRPHLGSCLLLFGLCHRPAFLSVCVRVSPCLLCPSFFLLAGCLPCGGAKFCHKGVQEQCAPKFGIIRGEAGYAKTLERLGDGAGGCRSFEVMKGWCTGSLG